ncbi:MAG: DUF3179 domain-containing protein [Candidatus Rokubacteria bacterium]|nr:DUF3179 domain-containing protein [Candidatus Rokubacteria bacterium]
MARVPYLERDPVSPELRTSGMLAIVTLLLLLGATVAGAGPLRTDFTKALVPLEEIVPGGPPPDGIPAIDRPVFVAAGAADAWLPPAEPVVAVEVNGDARAYPLRVMIWHEIVNDTVGGKAVAVTYCPLCNSGLVFDRQVDGRALDFGTSGMLFKSDLVMYDRQTHSLWAQMEGRAIVGELAGVRLAMIPANTIAYADFKAAYPGGKVLSQETGFSRRYGLNPYGYYDQPNLDPFLLKGAPDRRRPPKERVVGVLLGGAPRAYPWPALVKQRVIHDAVSVEPLVIFYQPGARSALDEPRMEQSRSIGATGVFNPTVAGRSLTFEPAGDGFRDRETGSVWNLLGHAVKGPLAGQRLRAVPHVDAFWFAWAAFHPSTSVYGGP